MRRGGARTWANVASKARKGSVRNADGVPVLRARQASEVSTAKDIGVRESAGIECLIPPREGAIEAALGSQDLLEGPDIVAMPYQKFGVAVDVGHVELVKADEVLVAARCRREIARRRLLHQALDSTHEGLAVRSRELAPFEAHVGAGTTCRCG